MSILSNFLSDLHALLFPPVCPVCGGPMNEGARTVCTRCRTTIPLTRYWEEFDNPMTRRLWGLVPVVHASALFFFVGGGGWRRLIHGFKYRGAWRLARDMGRWYGSYLADCGLYDDVEVVVPVPLHLRKRLKRGYNQSEYLAEGIAAELDVGVDRRSVVRRRNNPSQALSRKSDRWANVEGVFGVRHPERLAGRHILLVDDVFTTGATIVSCAETILRSVPGCRISIAALAVSEHELGLDR
ncbi:MAG TPA: ComF family protein [Candidatus Alistipes excrementavium]|nr:ComF family protein [Candidatus Alistipes excrementavium]